MTEQTLGFGGARHRLQGWILFLLEEMGRVGFSPAPRDRLHLLLFFSAVLTPVHGLDNPVPKIIKYRDKPFYPEGQDELDSFVVRGFVASGTRVSIRDVGDDASYALTLAGYEVTDLLRRSKWGGEVSSFARDLVDSFANLSPENADHIVAEDATFRDGRMEFWEVRDLTKSNQSKDTARWVADVDIDGIRPKPRDSIALYFEFLQARRAA